jgi:hypothetical protein
MPGRHYARSRARGARRHPRWSIGGRSSLAIAAIVVISVLATAGQAGAVIFDRGESIGKFKVLGGHFTQQVNYLANYKYDSFDSVGSCWTYKYSDQGSSRYALSFDAGQVSPLKYRTGWVDFVHGLRVTGEIARKWSGTVTSDRGPDYDADDCPAPTPWEGEPAVCGDKKVKGVDSFPLGLTPTKGIKPLGSGEDAAFWGPILENDPLSSCVSDSAYGSQALVAQSDNGMKQLDHVKVGDTIKLAGESSVKGPGPEGFIVPFEWTSGSQQAKVDWALKLKRVAKGG